MTSGTITRRLVRPGWELRICPDCDFLAREAAGLFFSNGSRALDACGRFHVAVSGGETPRLFFQKLAAEPSFRWQNVHVFWADERCVPLEAPENHWKMATELWLSHVPIPQDHIHRIQVERSPGEAAEIYEKELERVLSATRGSLHTAFLGLGEDGHTASLYPGAEATKTHTRLVAAHFVAQRGQWRVTLTDQALRAADHLIFYVSGRRKSTALKDVLALESPTWQLPASQIAWGHPSVLWLADAEAAQDVCNLGQPL